MGICSIEPISPAILSHSLAAPKPVGFRPVCKAFAMSDPVIVILVSVGLAIIVAIWAMAMWNSRQSARYLMRGVGLILVIVGALVTGITELAVDGVRGVIGWLNEKVLDTATWVGIAVAVVGIVSFIIGGAIKAPTRADAKIRRLEREARQREKLASKVGRTKPQPVQSKPAEPAEPVAASAETKADAAAPPLPESKPASSNPDDEVANILRKHGIE